MGYFANRERFALYAHSFGLLIAVAALSTISARDPDGVWLRIGMVLMAAGVAMWLPWQALLPAALLIWFGPNYARSLTQDYELFHTAMLLELPAVIGVTMFASLARRALHQLGDPMSSRMVAGTIVQGAGIDPITGVYEERLLIPAVEAELVRSRRFGRDFALVLAGLDEMHERFDYRVEATWREGLQATAGILLKTRQHIDRVYRYGEGFALILPESGTREVSGLVRRLRRLSRNASPSEGQPGGPMPVMYGATFFPNCATTVEDLMRRAEIAMRLAGKNANRLQIDSAEALPPPSPQTLRLDDTPEIEEAPPEVETMLPHPVSNGNRALVSLPSPELHAEVVPAQRFDVLTAVVTDAMKEPALLPSIVPQMEPVSLHNYDEPHAIVEESAPLESYEDEPEQVVEEPTTLHAEEQPKVTIEEPARPYEYDEYEYYEYGNVEEPTPLRIEEQPVAVLDEPVPLHAYDGGADEAIEEPVLLTSVAQSTSEERDSAALGQSVEELLRHLDETLDLIRTLKEEPGRLAS